MSETSEVVENPPEEPEPAVEENTEDIQSTETAVDTIMISKKDSDVSMLEDEEMPTFSSFSSSTKPNNSASIHERRIDDVPVERKRTPSPDPSDFEDDESICILSSSAETELNEDTADDAEEEDLDEYDSDEVIDEEEEDEDDNYDRDRFERDSDESEADRFERASDDFILRHNIIRKPEKERSQSLQDLSIVEARFGKRRNSRFAWERSGFKKNPYSYQSSQPKLYSGSGRYEHIESKVKRYIQDIKEQNKTTKHEEYAEGKNSEYRKTKDFNENGRKSSASSRNIKDYAEKVIKELEGEECPDDVNPSFAILERMENGEEPMTLRLSSDRVSSDSNMVMEVDNSPPRKQNHEGKLEKTNGIIEFNKDSEVTFTPIIKGRVSPNRVNEHLNGAEPATNFNLRTLTYEEYMHVGHEQEVAANEICLVSPDKPSYDGLRNTDPIEVSNVRKNHEISEDYEDDEVYEEDVENSISMFQATEKIKSDNREVIMLRTSLNQKNAQFDCLQVAYQKIVEENMSMRQEIENLKKALIENEKNQIREKKSAAIQTEMPENAFSQKNTLNVGNGVNKMSISSINSAVSSIHQWSESACSPNISTPLPDVQKVLNSDESSVFEKTPERKPRTFSRAFLTSSRILQTLSNITRGKTNICNPLVQDLKNPEARENCAQFIDDPSTSTTPLNSKKRKATEMLGATTSEQPFKIPHTTGSEKKKLSHDSGNETSQMNGLPSESEDCMENEVEGEIQEGNTKKGDLGDGLKYFIYKDDENSKDRSFLIQAEDPGKLANTGIVRECGPYLLGNLEIRMTEVNGTINIWGKELNLESSGEEFEISTKSAELKSGLCWEKTPRVNNLSNTPLLSSTNKKSNPQSRYSDPNNLKFFHSSGNTIPKCSPQVNERSYHRRSSLITDDNHNCNLRSHRLSWSGCKHLMEEQKHACCSHNPEKSYERYGCSHSGGRHDCHPCNRVQSCAGDFRRHSFSATTNDSSARQCSCHGPKIANEAMYRHQSPHCRSFHDEEDSCKHFSKSCHSSGESSHFCSPKYDEFKESCCPNRSSSTQNEDDPLIRAQPSNEPPEVRKRRLSGKKVRGLLMDLLKGCGDCRAPNTSNISKSSLRGTEPSYKPTCPPEIIVTACTPRASYSDQSKSMEKNRCCDTCSRRIEMTSEIETQLEFFRVEMERLRSRSDALLDKLNMLKSTDVN